MDNKLSLSEPQQALSFATDLKNFITEKKLSTNIAGKDYINVEGWQFAGMMMGLYPVVVELENLSRSEQITTGGKSFLSKIYKFKATVELRDVRDNSVKGVGIAFCSNEEPMKRSFQEYAVASMAQTRAVGKAYRNLLGFLVKAAGFESTPSEEMQELENIGKDIN